ncbi:flavoprotein [Methanosphaera sp.]
MKIIWAITGAGHLLKESIEVLEKISKKHEITIITSKAGQEVLQLYGYNNKIKKILEKPGNTYITDAEQQYSYPLSGKLTHEKYDLIVISPTTANTTAKIVHGIADTLITNVAAQSGKGQIPQIIVPVDQKEGLITTQLPPYIDKKKCKQCKTCTANDKCPQKIINPPYIDTTKCNSCLKCEDACPYNAVITKKEIQLYIRKIDAQNTKKLEEIENTTTLLNPNEIIKKIEEMN